MTCHALKFDQLEIFVFGLSYVLCYWRVLPQPIGAACRPRERSFSLLDLPMTSTQSCDLVGCQSCLCCRQCLCWRHPPRFVCCLHVLDDCQCLRSRRCLCCLHALGYLNRWRRWLCCRHYCMGVLTPLAGLVVWMMAKGNPRRSVCMQLGRRLCGGRVNFLLVL